LLVSMTTMGFWLIYGLLFFGVALLQAVAASRAATIVIVRKVRFMGSSLQESR